MRNIYLSVLCLLLVAYSTSSHSGNLEPDEYYLTQGIYFESGVEPYVCKIKLAQTIMNRVNKRSWKNTIKEVLWQPKQFSYTSDSKPETMPQTARTYMESFSAAQAVLYGNLADISRGADHFINHKIADPKVTWYKNMKFVGRCGDHWFYKSNMR